MAPTSTAVSCGKLIHGDALEVLPSLPAEYFQVIIADAPYYQVLTGQDWDNKWNSPDDYIEWMASWVRECRRVLRPDGLLFVFGQVGQREHVWLHVASRLAREMQFHDMIIWDRAVGYNERQDSFTPQYEMILALRPSQATKPYFDKDAVRIPYAAATIQTYRKDQRYKDREARLRHLELGKHATNILRVPSLKGASKEKAGHPSQKPLVLISHLVRAASRPGDFVLDPFLGSGTTAVAAENLDRHWVGIEEKHAYAAMATRRIQKAAEDRARPAPGSHE